MYCFSVLTSLVPGLVHCYYKLGELSSSLSKFYMFISARLTYAYTCFSSEFTWCILDGAECNRKFIKMHFPEYDAADKKFVAFNMHTGGPMVFIVDCKVIRQCLLSSLILSRMSASSPLFLKSKGQLQSQLVSGQQLSVTHVNGQSVSGWTY